METWDYVVVGAGSAGCVVARRLSDNPSMRVLLIEAGPSSKTFWSNVPAGMAMLIGDERFDWRYMTEPVPALNGRRISWPRGKTLGGSSAINGMVYTRGNRRDYEHWVSLGNPGWGWTDILPYYKRMEDNVRGANEFRGQGGPLKISDAAPASRAVQAFIEAAHRCGIERVDDLSVAGEEGVGLLQATIHKGVRQTTYDAFIAPVRHRGNLDVLTEAHVARVLVEGAAAVGVEVIENGKLRTIRAAREVILSAGVTNSPHILMLSGIGDAEHLGAHGIRARVHLPGVGKNLQDHVGAHVKVQTRPGWSHNRDLRGWRKYREGLRYVVAKTGYLGASATLAAAFVRSSSKVDYADLEIGFRPMTFSQAPNGNILVDDCDAISANVYRVRPASRGEILLRSADPLQSPAFHANFLSAPEDQEATLSGLRLIRRVLSTDPIASGIVGELQPGPEARSDEQLIEFVGKYGKSSYHPVGTCKMGNDALAVVDARLRVRGVNRLRVIDASVMPTPTSGNTAAGTTMIGEKGADMILADAMDILPPT
ncbi:GMC family oxidoreductase [Cupriavidus lacunae]|uniref:Choline dehydrogenase n=1 Tax=Cupriavidus lacunae TaxID=2666307 RepID=A0A370NLQ2_9BURK|nr:GMC family oxidoreductase N-terminal domain-containing protein [Cupriavidus lacunae]RDK06512.1 choline dehydrogenase [Cupriavidus lacunae]